MPGRPGQYGTENCRKIYEHFIRREDAIPNRTECRKSRAPFSNRISPVTDARAMERKEGVINSFDRDKDRTRSTFSTAQCLFRLNLLLRRNETNPTAAAVPRTTIDLIIHPHVSTDGPLSAIAPFPFPVRLLGRFALRRFIFGRAG